jgi:hypothetical protein
MSEETLAAYVASQDELVKEAVSVAAIFELFWKYSTLFKGLALPHQFSQCTYALGPVRYASHSLSARSTRIADPKLAGKRYTSVSHAQRPAASVQRAQSHATRTTIKLNCASIPSKS